MKVVTQQEVETKEALFFKALAEGDTAQQACTKSGLKSEYVYNRKASDKDFAARWQAAYDQVTDLIEFCAIKRATAGYQKPVYHRGQVVGHEPVYSDALAAFLLKGRRPAVYRDRSSLDVSGTVTLESLVSASFGGSAEGPQSGPVVENASDIKQIE